MALALLALGALAALGQLELEGLELGLALLLGLGQQLGGGGPLLLRLAGGDVAELDDLALGRGPDRGDLALGRGPQLATSWSVVVRSWLVSALGLGPQRLGLAAGVGPQVVDLALGGVAHGLGLALGRGLDRGGDGGPSRPPPWTRGGRRRSSASRLDSPRCSLACSSARRRSCSTRLPRPDRVGWARSSRALVCSVTLRSSSLMRSRGRAGLARARCRSAPRCGRAAAR